MTITRTSISIISFATVLLFVSFAFIAQAQEDEITPRERFLEMQAEAQANKADFEENQQERRAGIQENRAELQEKASERKEEFKAQSEERKAELVEKKGERREALQARTQERIANLAANVSNRMEAAIVRIRQIIERFQTRMDTLAENDVDVSEAQAALNESSGHLDDAQALISGIDSLVAEVVASESPREAWAGARETYREITTHIKAAHTSLRTALSLLKEAVAEAGLARGASSTTTNENDADSDDDSIVDESDTAE